MRISRVGELLAMVGARIEQVRLGEDLDFSLLLNDPFANSDDERARAGMRVLAESLAREHQVIVMTCHRHRHERLASLDPDVWAAGVQWLELKAAAIRPV